jgi:hypothetical protein
MARGAGGGEAGQGSRAGAVLVVVIPEDGEATTHEGTQGPTSTRQNFLVSR